MKQSIWTDEVDTAICEGLKSGLSYSQIGEQFKFSRSQISGRVFRLRKHSPEKLPVEFRSPASSLREADRNRNIANAKRKSQSSGNSDAKPARKSLDEIEKNILPDTLIKPKNKPVTFMDLERGQCTFCVDDLSEPASAQMMCCGAEVIDRYAREGDRKATHCNYHYERVVDRSYQALRRIKNARSAPKDKGVIKCD